MIVFCIFWINTKTIRCRQVACFKDTDKNAYATGKNINIALLSGKSGKSRLRAILISSCCLPSVIPKNEGQEPR